MDDWEPEKPVIKKQDDNTNSSTSSLNKYTISDLIGGDTEDKFLSFDLTEVRELLDSLQGSGVPDLANAEQLQKESLRCADILSDYIGKVSKTISFIDSELTKKKNQVALHYKAPEGRTSIELRKMAGESSDEVQDVAVKLAKAKGAKLALDKKYEIVIKLHHYYKDIASGYRKTINFSD